MFQKFYGTNPNFPSRIKLLCEGSFSYKDFFDTKIETTTNKDTTSTNQIETEAIKKPKSIESKNTTNQ